MNQAPSKGQVALADFRMTLEAQAQKWALPPQISRARMKQVIATAISQNPELLECTQKSLWTAVMRAVTDGLLPDGKQGAMVVRNNWKAKVKEVQWQPMIEGLRIKARNSGEILDWQCDVVREKDHFIFRKGDDPMIEHIPVLKDAGPIIAAYSIARLDGGSHGILLSREVMPIDEIYAIRDRYSEGWKAFKENKIKSTPWADAEGEMIKKTVARRHSKVLPLSAELIDMVHRMDADSVLPEDEATGEIPPEVRPQITDYTDVIDTSEEGQPDNEKQPDVEITPTERAFREGQAARKANRALAAVPGELRDQTELAKAWQDGWRKQDSEK